MTLKRKFFIWLVFAINYQLVSLLLWWLWGDSFFIIGFIASFVSAYISIWSIEKKEKNL